MTIGDWIALVGTIAAIVAAIYAFRADAFGRKQARRADVARKHDVRPLPRVRWLGAGLGSDSLGFFNVGAAAFHLVWVGYSRGRVYCAWCSLPENLSGYMPIVPTEVGALPEQAAKRDLGNLIMVAQDREGSWWDCLRHVPLPTEPPIRFQVDTMLASLGLSAMARAIKEVCRLEPRPNQAAT